MPEYLWSWVLTFAGVLCFWLAGRKIWWAWYVGLASQVLWLVYSIQTEQWGFLASCIFFTIIFAGNARRWTKEHYESRVEAAVD